MNEPINVQAQQALRRYEADIDPQRAEVLTSGRFEALKALEKKHHRYARPAQGLALASVFFLMIVGPASLYDLSLDKASPALSASVENLDLYEELEFYQWYAAQESAGGS